MGRCVTFCSLDWKCWNDGTFPTFLISQAEACDVKPMRWGSFPVVSAAQYMECGWHLLRVIAKAEYPASQGHCRAGSAAETGPVDESRLLFSSRILQASLEWIIFTGQVLTGNGVQECSLSCLRMPPFTLRFGGKKGFFYEACDYPVYGAFSSQPPLQMAPFLPFLKTKFPKREACPG